MISHGGTTDVVGTRLDRLESRFDALSYAIEMIGHHIVTRKALFRPPSETEVQPQSEPVVRVDHLGIDRIKKELSVLMELTSRLSNVIDAFAPCVEEVKQAGKVGRVDDNSFSNIYRTWGKCKGNFLPKLRAYASEAKEKTHFVEEHLLELNEQVNGLDKIIDGDDRGNISSAVDEFNEVLRVVHEKVQIRMTDLVRQLPGSEGDQTNA